MSASSHNLSPRLWTPKPSPPRKVFLSAACVSPSREAAVEGRLPRGIGIERLRDPPTEWSAQFEALGLNPKQPQPRPAFPELLWRNARNTALDHRHRETDFLDAETKRQKPSFKRANARRDQNPGNEWPKIPAETPYLALYRKPVVCGDWMVVWAVRYEPVSRQNSRLLGNLTGNFVNFGHFCPKSTREVLLPAGIPGQFPM